MMSVSSLTAREIQLEALEKFIDESKSKLNKILNELEWTPEETLSVRQGSHKACKDEHNWPPGRHSINLDTAEFNSATVGTSATDHKLAIYEYCIKKTGRLSEPEMSIMIHPDDGGSKKVTTFAEIVAEKRNAKRRTVRYRTGATQSYLGEVRNLIELQMSALSQYVSDTKKTKNRDQDTEERDNSDLQLVSRYRERDKPTTSAYRNEHDRYGSEKQSSSSASSSRKHKRKEKGRIPRHHYDSNR